MKSLIYKVLCYFKGAGSEMNGQPSSKRLSALYVVFVLVSATLFALLYIPYHASQTGVEIKASVLDMLHFLGSVVLSLLLSFAGMIYGFNMSQNKTWINANPGTPPPDLSPKDVPAPDQPDPNTQPQ